MRTEPSRGSVFLAHYAAALGAKKLAPETSLGTLCAGAVLLDLVWPVLLIAGLETVNVDAGATAFTPLDFSGYPYSHSLLAAALWSGLFGAVCFAASGRKPSAAPAVAVAAALVLSHWFIDALAHRPDLPLTPWGEARIGLGLWNSIPATLAVELSAFAAGLWLYIGTARPATARAWWPLGALAAMLLLTFLAAAFGPPPPDPQAVAWSGLGQLLFVAAAAWADARARRA